MNIHTILTTISERFSQTEKIRNFLIKVLKLNSFIAGGSVLYCYSHIEFEDVDIFVSEENFKDIVSLIFSTFDIVRIIHLGLDVLTFQIKDEEKTLQIIKRNKNVIISNSWEDRIIEEREDTLENLIFSFDYDVCGFGISQSEIFIHPTAVESLRKMEINEMFPKKIRRGLKYIKKGFKMVICSIIPDTLFEFFTPLEITNVDDFTTEKILKILAKYRYNENGYIVNKPKNYEKVILYGNQLKVTKILKQKLEWANFEHSYFICENAGKEIALSEIITTLEFCEIKKEYYYNGRIRSPFSDEWRKGFLDPEEICENKALFKGEEVKVFFPKEATNNKFFNDFLMKFGGTPSKEVSDLRVHNEASYQHNLGRIMRENYQSIINNFEEFKYLILSQPFTQRIRLIYGAFDTIKLPYVNSLSRYSPRSSEIEDPILIKDTPLSELIPFLDLSGKKCKCLISPSLGERGENYLQIVEIFSFEDEINQIKVEKENLKLKRESKFNFIMDIVFLYYDLCEEKNIYSNIVDVDISP